MNSKCKAVQFRVDGEVLIHSIEAVTFNVLTTKRSN